MKFMGNMNRRNDCDVAYVFSFFKQLKCDEVMMMQISFRVQEDATLTFKSS